jgi:PAS domain S-box-containing protein
MAEKPTYEELEQRVKELEALEAKHKENVVALEHLFDLSLDMLCIADTNAYFKHTNKAFEKTLGYTKEELLKESFLQFIHPDDIASTIAEVEKLSRGEPTIYFENRYRCKDSSYKRLAWTSMPDLEHGLMYAVARDMTEHKRTEQTLRESEERYRLIFNEMVSGFALHEVICDKNGKPYDYRFLDLNPAFERLTGLRRVDILGKTVLEVLPKTETYWIDTYGEVALSGKPAHFENYSEALDRYYEVLAFRPQKDQFAVTFTDITTRVRSEEALKKAYDELEQRIEERTAELTKLNEQLKQNLKERKQVEQALRESEEKYSNLFHFSNDGIFVHDLEGNILDVNQKALDQLGYTKSEMLSFKIPDFHPPEALEISQWAFETIIREGFVSFETDFKKKTGEVLPFEVSSSLYEIGDKKVIQGIIRDITERKQAEEERKKLINELQKALKEIKTLRGILPLCSFCKKIRDDKGYWEQVDVYIYKYSEADISHSICPECAKEHYPDLDI